VGGGATASLSPSPSLPERLPPPSPAHRRLSPQMPSRPGPTRPRPSPRRAGRRGTACGSPWAAPSRWWWRVWPARRHPAPPPTVARRPAMGRAAPPPPRPPLPRARRWRLRGRASSAGPGPNSSLAGRSTPALRSARSWTPLNLLPAAPHALGAARLRRRGRRRGRPSPGRRCLARLQRGPVRAWGAASPPSGLLFEAAVGPVVAHAADSRRLGVRPGARSRARAP
jgi:hypothetical protein